MARFSGSSKFVAVSAIAGLMAFVPLSFGTEADSEGLVRLSQACADEAGIEACIETPGICSTANADHRGFRNSTAPPRDEG